MGAHFRADPPPPGRGDRVFLPVLNVDDQGKCKGDTGRIDIRIFSAIFPFHPGGNGGCGDNFKKLIEI